MAKLKMNTYTYGGMINLSEQGHTKQKKINFYLSVAEKSLDTV